MLFSMLSLNDCALLLTVAEIYGFIKIVRFGIQLSILLFLLHDMIRNSWSLGDLHMHSNSSTIDICALVRPSI